MVAKRSFLLVALVSAVVSALVPTTAEARFGSRSGGSSGGSSGGASHAATGVGRGGTYYTGGRYYGGYRYYGYHGYPSFYYGWGFGYYPYFGYYAPYYYPAYAYPVAEQPVIAQKAPPPVVHATFLADAQTVSTNTGGTFATDRGGIVGLSARLEGERVGLRARFTSIFPRWDNNIDTYVGWESIKLFDLFLTYALISTPHSRLRIEGGLSSAFTHWLTTAGFGAGLSLEANIFGPIGIEGGVHGTPYPFEEFVWNAGLTLTFGPVGLHGGWRRIFLNDRGLVDGTVNKDSFSGPYASLGVTL
jgi:hypothetical protein